MQKTFAPLEEQKEKKSTQRIDEFMTAFNKQIKKGDFTVNTGLQKCPTLNDAEFKKVVGFAKRQGYTITRFDDNYNTTTYKIEKGIPKVDGWDAVVEKFGELNDEQGRLIEFLMKNYTVLPK